MLFYGILPNNQIVLMAVLFNEQNPSVAQVVAKSDEVCLISHALHSLQLIMANDC